MDVKYILIILSVLIIFSYLFDIIARKTKFPSVIMLIFTGIGIGYAAEKLGFNVDFFDEILPLMGKIGLILIVLEGALELQIKKEKLGIIYKGLLAAFVILIVNVWVLGLVFEHLFSIEHKSAIIYAIPLSIISSAVAIPSAASLLKLDKEFVVYESTFSDILGIMLFNYAIRQFGAEDPSLLGFQPLLILLLQIVAFIVASIIITFLLFELIERIEHNVKFFLIFAILLLMYAIGDYFHLPSLVLIFIFGLIMSNSVTLMPPFLRKFISFTKAEKELHQFHILTAESTFVVRTFFFLTFGLLIPVESFLEVQPYFYGLIILLIMLSIRFLYLLVTQRKKITPLVFLSPRGLITILLFMKIPTEAPTLVNSIIDEKVLLIVILGSMMIMLVGTLGGKKEDKNPEDEGEIDEMISDEGTTTYFDVNKEMD